MRTHKLKQEIREYSKSIPNSPSAHSPPPTYVVCFSSPKIEWLFCRWMMNGPIQAVSNNPFEWRIGFIIVDIISNQSAKLKILLPILDSPSAGNIVQEN